MKIKYLSLLIMYLTTTVNISLFPNLEKSKNILINNQTTISLIAKVPSNLGLPERRENGGTRFNYRDFKK